MLPGRSNHSRSSISTAAANPWVVGVFAARSTHPVPTGGADDAPHEDIQTEF